jgi:carboxyl-terminal processing protease
MLGMTGMACYTENLMGTKQTKPDTIDAKLPNYQRSSYSMKAKLLTVVAILSVFSLGLNIGNGSLSLSSIKGAPTKANNLPAKIDYSSVTNVYNSLKANYDGTVSETELLDGLKHGLAKATNDPYTVFFTAKEAKDFNDQLNNSFAGIGARLSRDADKNLTVAESIAGFPAAKAGLKAKDIIVAINGQDPTDLTLDDAISKIRGPAGSTVKLKIVRDKSQQIDISITREVIALPTVTTEIKDGNIGYMRITGFGDDTTQLAQKAAQDFASKKVSGIILDLRNNPGGLLNSAVDISSLWLPQGKTVLQEKRGSVVQDTYQSRGGNILSGIPTVVLMNGGSASASEITAGALHDNGAARIIGEKSYGKGVVQQLINFKDGSQLKVTVASWYRPNGQNINKKGIEPDDKVTISDAEAKAMTDTQLQAAQTYLMKK